jgi:hypothetical protein
MTKQLNDGSTISYDVMPDYITIDGVRVTMSGTTAMNVARHFGLSLPTAAVSKQIWESADIKGRAQPLSAGGKIGDKYYSGSQIVGRKMMDSDAAVAYSDQNNEWINKEKNKFQGKEPIVAGHMKDINISEGDKLYFSGWYGADGKPLQPAGTAHEISYVDYSHGTRLVSPNAKRTYPNGTTEIIPIKDISI